MTAEIETSPESASDASEIVATGPVDTGAIASAIDSYPELRDSSILYVAADLNVMVRSSNDILCKQVMVTPNDETKPSSAEMKSALMMAGVDCGIAAVSAVGATAACASTVASSGITAALCIFQTTDALASAFSCGTAISKAYATAYDPEFLAQMERSSTLKETEAIVSGVGLFASVLSLSAQAKNSIKIVRGANKLKNASNLLGKDVLSSGKKMRVNALKDISGEVGEMFESNQQVKAFLKEAGIKPNMKPRHFQPSFEDAIRRSVKGVGWEGAKSLPGDVRNGQTIQDARKMGQKAHSIHVIQSVNDQPTKKICGPGPQMRSARP